MSLNTYFPPSQYFLLLSLLGPLSLKLSEFNKILYRIFLIEVLRCGGPKALHFMTLQEKWALFNTTQVK
jgi:hypothetical protein